MQNDLTQELSANFNDNDLIFCISGSLNSISRKELIKKIRNKGWHVGDHVTEKTNYLICNDINLNHTKVHNAIAYSIPIITEEKIINMIEIIN